MNRPRIVKKKEKKANNSSSPAVKNTFIRLLFHRSFQLVSPPVRQLLQEVRANSERCSGCETCRLALVQSAL